MKKIIILMITVSATEFTFPQDTDSAKKTSSPATITGSVDGYYRYNFNNPKTKKYIRTNAFRKFQN